MSELTIIYTDGACTNNGYVNAKAGYGIYFSPESKIKPNYKVSLKVPSSLKQSNNVAELLGIIHAIQILEKENFNSKVDIYTDSKYCMLMASKTVFTEKTKNIELVKLLSELIVKYSHLITLKYIRAHTNNDDQHSIGNKEADLLATNSIKEFQKKNKSDSVKPQRIYLNVSYQEKDDAKKLGAKWDRSKKKWYCYSDNKTSLMDRKIDE